MHDSVVEIVIYNVKPNINGNLRGHKGHNDELFFFLRRDYLDTSYGYKEDLADWPINDKKVFST